MCGWVSNACVCVCNVWMCVCVCVCDSTILEEEKQQMEERLRMEMRRQVNVSWDSGGSEDAPPKVPHLSVCLSTPTCRSVYTYLLV